MPTHRPRPTPVGGAAIEPLAQSAKRHSVLVLGAGLAGLSAAYELRAAGHEVTVLEARDRVGGRVETLRDGLPPGLYAEAGALFVEPHHERVHHYIDEFKLDLIPFPAADAWSNVWRLRGMAIDPSTPPSQWPVKLSPAEAKAVATSGMAGLFTRYVVPLITKGQAEQDFTDRIPAALQPYDDVTFAKCLEHAGASLEAIELLRLGYFDLWGDGVDSVSALFIIRDLVHSADLGHRQAASSKKGQSADIPASRIRGGNDHLPRAFAERLGDRIRLGREVTRIESTRTSVKVTSVHGRKTYVDEADRVVCTIPFSVLRHVAITPALSPEKTAAIQQLAYTDVCRVFIGTKNRVWHPTAGKAHKAPKAQAVGTGNTDIAIQWINDAAVGLEGDAGILESYSAGARARAMRSMTLEERIVDVRRWLAAVYPGLEVDDQHAACKDWSADPFARGGYCWFRPGEMRRWLPVIGATEGRLHFAGDHTSPAPGWMEGALESGLRAAREVHAAR